jgi:hypothetical protein
VPAGAICAAIEAAVLAAFLGPAFRRAKISRS